MLEIYKSYTKILCTNPGYYRILCTCFSILLLYKCLKINIIKKNKNYQLVFICLYIFILLIPFYLYIKPTHIKLHRYVQKLKRKDKHFRQIPTYSKSFDIFTQNLVTRKTCIFPPKIAT